MFAVPVFMSQAELEQRAIALAVQGSREVWIDAGETTRAFSPGVVSSVSAAMSPATRGVIFARASFDDVTADAAVELLRAHGGHIDTVQFLACRVPARVVAAAVAHTAAWVVQFAEPCVFAEWAEGAAETDAFFAAVAQTNPAMIQLDFVNMKPFPGWFVPRLASALRSRECTVKMVKFIGCDPSSDDVRAFAGAVSAAPNLVKFEFSGCAFAGAGDALRLASAVLARQSPDLLPFEKIDMRVTSVDDATARALARAVTACGAMHTFLVNGVSPAGEAEITAAAAARAVPLAKLEINRGTVAAAPALHIAGDVLMRLLHAPAASQELVPREFTATLPTGRVVVHHAGEPIEVFAARLANDGGAA